MKKKVRGFSWGCIGIALFVVGIRFLTTLTDPGYAYCKNKEFIDDSEMYDVLFFGNSHMANAVFPMELWHDYGIVSYNLAGFGNPIPAVYWVMRNALDSAQPELVVVDCYNYRTDGKAGKKEMLHASVDHMPLSVEKIRMIRDLVDDPKDRLEFYWDFSTYHDRWWDLDQADFEKVINVQKGAEISVDVTSPMETKGRPNEEVVIQSLGEEYLRRIIEECQERNIEVLLTYLPYPASEESWQEAMYAEQIAQEYGISYINFLDLSVVDLETDCSDKNSHLNGSGGHKVTDYIGRYIEEHYDIADHREEEAYAGWNEDYKRYTDYKLDAMRQLESLDKYLMMCSDQAFDYYIYVNGKSGIWEQNEMYMPLIDNISGGKTDRLEMSVESGSDYFLIVDNQTGNCCESEGENSLFEVPEKNKVAVQITVVNRQDGSIVDEKRFDNKLVVYSE